MYTQPSQQQQEIIDYDSSNETNSLHHDDERQSVSNDDYDHDILKRQQRRLLGIGITLASFCFMGSLLIFIFGTGISKVQGRYLYDFAHGRRLQLAQQDKQSSSSGRIIDSSSSASFRLAIYSTAVDNDDYATTAVARKQRQDLLMAASRLDDNDNSLLQVESINYIMGQLEQLAFVQENCGAEAYQRMKELQSSNKVHWMAAIVQWCALSTAISENSSANGVIFLDPTSPIVLNTRFSDIFTYLNDYVLPIHGSDSKLPNIAVMGMESIRETIHGSFMLFRNTSQNNDMAKRMFQLLLRNDIQFEALEANALLFSQTLYTLIKKQSSHDWYFLEQQCRMQPPRRQAYASFERSLQDNEPHMFCPSFSGYCCSIQDKHGESLTVLMTRNLILPSQILDRSNILLPYNHRKTKNVETVVGDDELPYISTVSETLIPKPANFHHTPTFYELLSAKHCLPEDDTCSRCLREKSGATCHSCGSYCHCFCKALCNPDERPHTRHVAKKLTVTPPPYRRDPTRLIPRIVHQTWFEELTPSKYPNMSRLVQSFVRSGWEYKFYSDDQAGAFLSTHFPKEIREAYDALRPGAFKADLFRYCVLLIHGGVYADVDIQLEAALDLAVAPDIGFMVPIDEVRHECK
jgi:Glycosyltransferase sugar-binding region containing DXD motif